MKKINFLKEHKGLLGTTIALFSAIVVLLPIGKIIYKETFSMEMVLIYLLLVAILGIICLCNCTKGKAEKVSIGGLVFFIGFVCILLNNESNKTLYFNGTTITHDMGMEDEREYLFIDEQSEYKGVLCESKGFLLDKGKYYFGLSYEASHSGNYAEVWGNGKKLAAIPLDKENMYAGYKLSLEESCPFVTVRVYYNGGGDFLFKQLSIAPETRFYNDTYLGGVLWGVFAVLIVLLYKKTRKQSLPIETWWEVGILVWLVILTTWPFFSSGWIGMDDLFYHVQRIEGIKDGILDGQFPVNILPKALNGNGYLNSMYPYLFLYVPAVMRLCGVSMAFSYKFFIFMINIAMVIATYISLKAMTKSRFAVLLGTTLYMLLPYHFTDLYARGALGETLAFIFLPVVITGFYHVIFGDKSKWFYLVVGFTGLLQSHLLSAFVMGIIFSVGCLCFLKDIVIEKRWLVLLKAGIITLLLNLWFLLPFFFYFLKEKLQMEALDWTNFSGLGIKISSLLQTAGNDDMRYLAFGLPVVICGLLGLFHKFTRDKTQEREKEDRERYLTFLLVAGLILAFMVTEYFPGSDFMEIEVFRKILKMVQFPWRLIAPASIFLIVSGCIWLGEEKCFNTYRKLIGSIMVGLALLTTIGPMQESEYAYKNAYDTYRVGHEEKVVGIPQNAAKNLLPREWRIQGVSEDKLTTELVVSNEEQITILDYVKDGTKGYATYRTKEREAYLEIPLQFYLGYEVVDEYGQELTTQRGTNQCIRVYINGDGQEHSVYFQYRQPLLFMVGMWISFGTLIGLVTLWKIKKVQ